MNLWKLALGSLSVAALAAGLCGCLPSGSSPLDEQKEPHFLAGKARVNSLDFQGAIESYTKAIEVNPRSASAHFELGWLFDVKTPDPAAAIYHYEKYLKLRSSADNAELVRQRVSTCKQELAKAVLPLPVTPGMQREFEQLAEENKRLKEELARWQTYAASLARATSNAATPVLVMRRPDAAGAAATQAGATSGDTPGVSTQNPTPPKAAADSPVIRTHSVKAGDTPSGIARKYDVKLEALLAANPGINARRLKIGQKLRIPAP